MGGTREMIYYDAKNLSDVIFHLFIVMNNEVARDGIRKEYVDLLYVFESYLSPFLSKNEVEEIDKLNRQIEVEKIAKAILKKSHLLMKIAHKNKLLRKGVTNYTELDTWMQQYQNE